MPFPMKIQPIDFNTLEEAVPTPPIRSETVKPILKSCFKRLFERQLFPSVLRNSATEKVAAAAADELLPFYKGCTGADFEPSSVCLGKMVQNFIEEDNEKQQQSVAVSCSRNRCTCLNYNCNEVSEDEIDGFGFGYSKLTSSVVSPEYLKSLISCASVKERILLADTSKIVENNKKICKRKDDSCRKIVTDELVALGYDASICKSHWEKSPTYPAGEYEYIDVIIDGERLLVDIDFRSEFEIARSTKTYKSILQILPFIFVGKADRLQKIIGIVSEGVKQSLKKKGMHIPPWRKAEYIKAKWLSPHNRTRTTSPLFSPTTPTPTPTIGTFKDFELNPKVKNSVDDYELGESTFDLSESSEEEENEKKMDEWKLPEIKPKNSQIGVKILTGLASVIENEPGNF